MSEQKYYVKSKFWNGGQNYFTLDKNIIGDSFWSRWINPKTFEAPQQQFTKSELAEIKDGAFYKKAAYCEFMELPPDWEMRDEKDKWLCEWINPLIELVPVEEK